VKQSPGLYGREQGTEDKNKKGRKKKTRCNRVRIKKNRRGRRIQGEEVI
jgi:hypothetical protein